MKQEQTEPDTGGQEGCETPLSAWMKTANDFWGPMTKTRSKFFLSHEAQEGKDQEDMNETIEACLKTWQIFFPMLISPDLPGPVFKEIHAFPETFLKMSRAALEAYSNVQKDWLDRIRGIAQSAEASKNENGNQESFKAWMEMYEKEFRPFFAMPKLGLTRFYQERMATAMDQFNLYQAAMGNFYRLLYRPMEKSNRVLQEKLASQTEEGNAPENFQEYYRLWVKTLEGHYMNLFRSPEFTQTLAETLKATENFMEARRAVLEDLLKFVPVPTHKDMEDLYHELYRLKKKVKELEMKLSDGQPRQRKLQKANS